MDDRVSWMRYQPGLAGSTAPAIDEDIAVRRYAIEPHILDVVPFQGMTGQVLELGCGVSTDGLKIRRYAERYIGLDFSPLALRTAAQRHTEAGATTSHFCRADLRALPLPRSSVDFVYSHGVVHHVRENALVWREAHRVLRPGGTFCFMVYHRRSLNYYFGILLLRRVLLVGALLAPGVAGRLASHRGEPDVTLEEHRRGLREVGLRYIWGGDWLSRNTDGPQNTYSRVYSRRELRAALAAAGLDVDEMQVRYLNTRVNPPFGALPGKLQDWLGRRLGWHLYAIGHKI